MTIREILIDNQNDLAKIILSKSKNDFIKIVCKPIKLKSEKFWQIEKFTKQQVFHLNLDFDSFVKFIEDNFASNYMQMNVLTTNGEVTGLCSKNGKITFNKNSKSKTIVEVTQHNKQKNYLLSEGMDIPVLRDLGIFTMDNKVVQSMYDKFKQINRFVEILDDAFCNYNRDDITILDFGCGKSYLTFIVYYYFVYLKGIKAKVIGYDLKQDVVNNCNDLAKKYNYTDLRFYINDVTKDQLFDGQVDMLITLHACDIATDFALKYAIQNKVNYIFSVPCCQHEINSQIKNGGDFDVILQYGLLKERFSAILTDSIRATILKDFGYSVDVMEFVDFSHSPKNIMLRCKLIKSKTPTENKRLLELQKKYEFTQSLYKELY